MLRRLLKLALVFVVIFMATQAPFIYRRYQLGRLSAKIAELHAQRAIDQAGADADYKGVIHVHSFLGGHSPGTLAEIIGAAQSNRLDFVVMTEHPSAHFDTRAATLRGTHGGVLFVDGNETSESAQDRFLTFGGSVTQPPFNTPAAASASSSQAIIDSAKAAGQLVFVAHPETYTGWQTTANFDGMEIYNLHADAKNINRLSLIFDGLWSYRSYASLLWTRFYDSPDENLKRWDELTAQSGRRVVAIAGNDAHANIGLSLQELTGRPILQLKLDTYERSFQVVRTHVLLPREQPLTRERLLSALAQGHAYVSFDLLSDATGFRFTATSGAEEKLMGDEITLTAGETSLHVQTPLPSRIRLIRDGQLFSEEKQTVSREWKIDQPGVYRVEVYLPQLPAPLNEKPWIISNPIYVRQELGGRIQPKSVPPV